MMTKQMMYLFPAMTYFIALSLPAGLALYWAATSLFTIVQQTIVARTFHPAAKPAVTGVKTTSRTATAVAHAPGEVSLARRRNVESSA